VSREAGPKRAGPGLAVLGFCLAGLGALAAVLSGFGYRWALWDFGTGFMILRWAAYGALGAAAASIFGFVLSLWVRSWRGSLAALIGFAVAVATVWLPWGHIQQARDLPAIHDISTSLDDPPRFVAILPLRADAPNTADYGGPVIAALQQKAYPDVGPGLLKVPPKRAFEIAVAAARELGWEIVAEAPSEGRLEATDRTFWFGFTDDVVIRIRSHLFVGSDVVEGSRVDIRSVSRVGLSDLGTNARRVRAFLAKVTAASTANSTR
jgi:hypothetical protein